MSDTLPNTKRDCEAGITLVEMLVSLVIFAFVGLASFTMLDTLLKVRAQTEGRLETVAQIDRALAVFSHDLAQGEPKSLTLDNSQLTLKIAPEQRHEYTLNDTIFMRTIAPRFGIDDTLSQVLLPDVIDLQFGVLDTANIWHNMWPIEGITSLPRAVRLMLEVGKERKISRIVVLTDGVLP